MRRALRAAALLLAVATLAFAAIHAAPGAPFQPADGRALDPVAAAGLRARFALDAPLPVQYARWLAAAVQGDLGESFSRQRPVRDVLAAALPHSLLLAAAALLVDLLVGIALGAWQAAHAGSRGDRVLSAFTMSVQAVPVFWLGLVLVLVFAQWWHWLPVGGGDRSGDARPAHDGGAMARPAAAPRAPRAHPRPRRRGRHRAVRARGDAGRVA